MSPQPNGISPQPNGISPPPPTPDPTSSPPPRKLKILMLHGYTQSGPLFHAKTRALEKILLKAFPSTSNSNNKRSPSPLASTYPGGIELFYPTAPVKLLPADIPGFTPSADGNEVESDSWGWFKRETGSGLYIDLEKGLDTIASAIHAAGGIDGVIGFSQGGCMAFFVASLLEPNRLIAFQQHPSSFPYPKSFVPLLPLHPTGLKFCISYSGFYAPNPFYSAFYTPKLETRFLNVVGSLDSVVEEGRSLGLSERVREGRGRTVFHPGGHFVPVGKEMAGVVVGFLRECCLEKEEGEGEVGGEDMDVPF